MKILAIALGAMFLLLQYPLWLGKGGWLRVWELDRQVTQQRKVNEKLGQRNDALEGEVRDLKLGSLAVEERARYELGMVRSDETFVQINVRPIPLAPPPKPSMPGPVIQPAQVPAASKALAAAPADSSR